MHLLLSGCRNDGNRGKKEKGKGERKKEKRKEEKGDVGIIDHLVILRVG